MLAAPCISEIEGVDVDEEKIQRDDGGSDDSEIDIGARTAAIPGYHLIDHAFELDLHPIALAPRYWSLRPVRGAWHTDALAPCPIFSHNCRPAIETNH